MGRKTRWLNTFLAICLFFTFPLPQARPEVVELYPYDSVAFWSGVLSGEAWVNLSPFAKREELSSGQIAFPEMTDLLLYYDYRLKEIAKELVSGFGSDEDSVFRLWLVPEAVFPEVRFEVKAEGAEGIQEFVPELASIVNESQEFYPLRRAVYWFYRGRDWAGKIGLLRRGYPGRAYPEGTDWILSLYHRDLFSEEGIVGGIELPPLNIGADAYHAVEVEDFASRISRIYGRVVSDPDLTPGEKMYVLLSDLGMGMDKMGIEDVREMLERIWRRDEVWFAQGLMELAQRPDLLEPLILNWFFISRNPTVVRNRRYNPTVDFFRLFYSQFPVHSRELLDSAIDVFRNNRHEDIYLSLLALRMYLTKRSIDEVLEIRLGKEHVGKIARLGMGEDIALFIAGLTGSPLEFDSLSDRAKGFYQLGRLVESGIVDLDEEQWNSFVEFLGDADLFIDHPWLQDYLNDIASILGSSCPPNRLASFLESLSSQNPILLETMAKSDAFLDRLEGILPYLQEISLKTLIYLWTSVPEGKSGRKQVRYLLWNELGNLVSAINRIYYWQDDPFYATALLDFLVQRSIPNKLLESLFSDETLPREVRMRAGLYLAFRDNSYLREVWDEFLHWAQDKDFVKEVLSSCADPRLLEQKIKTVLTLLTPTVVSLSGQEEKDDLKRWMLEKILFARTVIRGGGFFGDASYAFHPLNMVLFARSNVSLLVGSILAHEITHNLVYGLLEEKVPSLEPGDLTRDVFSALISEFLADVGGLAVVERVLGSDGLQEWSRLLGRLFPLTILGENRPILVHSLEQYLLNRLLEKEVFQGGMTFGPLFQRSLKKLEDTNILDARNLDVLGFFESVLGGLFDPDRISDVLGELKLSLIKGKLSLVYPRWDPKSLWSLGEDGMSRRAFLRRLAIYGGLSALGTGGLMKLSRMMNPLAEREGKQPQDEVVMLQEEEPALGGEVVKTEKTVDPIQLKREFLSDVSRLAELLASQAIDSEEVEGLRGRLFEAFIRLMALLPEEELRELGGYAGSVDYRLGMNLLRQMVYRLNRDYLPGDVKKVLDTVDRVCVNAWRYRRKGDVSKLFDKEMRVYLFRQFGMKELTQRFIRYMSNPFWVFPVVSAQAYMAERGLNYPLQEIFAFAIKEGYDKFGKALEERKGLIWTNKWPVGLDRFGAPRVRFAVYSNDWLPEGFEDRFVERTNQRFHNRREVFPVVRFRALGGPLGPEYPVLLAMVALLRQDEALMMKALRSKGIARGEYDIARAHPSKRMFLRYLFYNSPTREEYRILTLAKDLLVPLDRRLPTWMIRSRIRDRRLALQVDKAVRATAISDAVWVFLPRELNDEVDRSLSRLLGILYAPLGGIVKRKLRKTSGDVDELFDEVRELLDEYSDEEAVKKGGFVKKFRRTGFYRLCGEFSKAVREGDRQRADKMWRDKLFPLIMRIARYEGESGAQTPRAIDKEKDSIILRDVGDYFLYRLSAIHGLVSLLPKGGVSEDDVEWSERIKRFFVKWIRFRDVVGPIGELAREHIFDPAISMKSKELGIWFDLADKEEDIERVVGEVSANWKTIMEDFAKGSTGEPRSDEELRVISDSKGEVFAFLFGERLILPRPFDPYVLDVVTKEFDSVKDSAVMKRYTEVFSREVYTWQEGPRSLMWRGNVYEIENPQWLEKDELLEAVHSAVLQGYRVVSLLRHPEKGYLLLLHKVDEPISEEELTQLREELRDLASKVTEEAFSEQELDLLGGMLDLDLRLGSYRDEVTSILEKLGSKDVLERMEQLVSQIRANWNQPGGIILE